MSDVAPTPQQRAAIDARERDVLCEAGAGTGKTRVLVGRYCDAIELDEIEIGSILAFTFTERAAAELRTRIRRELARRASAARERGDAELAQRLNHASRDTEGAWVTTIHGFCRRVLAAHPAAAGIDPRFRILDHGEASRLRLHARDDAVNDVAALDLEAVGVIAAYQSRRIGEMAVAAYDRLRSQGMAEPRLPPADQPVRSIKDTDADQPELSPADAAGAVAARRTLELLVEAFGRRYSELKTERSGLDFADLELGALALLRGLPAVSASWRGRFEHVMVDEFQDTNAVQLELVEQLRGPETRVFRVGDELQSIYRFRNADLAVFRGERERAKADPATAVLPLTGNFRARPEIVAAVNTLGTALLGGEFTALAHQRDPVPAGAAPPVELLLTLDEGKRNGWKQHGEALSPPPSETQAKLVAEALALALRLRELVDAGEASPRDIVILLRAFTHVDAYEDALDRAGLDPYVVGGRGYWSQQQVEDLLRLLECVANPLDDEMLIGALACPASGVSPDALWLLRRAIADDQAADRARRSRRHLWPLIEWRFGDSEHRPEPLAEHWLDAIPAEDRERLCRFCALLAGLRAAAPVLGLDQVVERTMTAFGYDLELLRRPRGAGRMANVRKLMRLALEFEAHEGRDLRGFLASARELTERDEREGLAAVQAEDHDGVRIMTVHAAKGLEFPVVAVPDLARGLAQGERPGDVVIGRLGGGPGEAAAARMGLRLALPAAKSFEVWEFHELNHGNVVEAAEEGARLAHVAATRAQERLILSGAFRPEDLEPKEPEAKDSVLRRLLPALRALGWNGGDGEVTIEPPAPADGAAALVEAPRIEVRISAPSAERARLLAARREAPIPPAAAAAAPTPPLARPDRVVPAGHLSYSALADYKSCAYRFHVERMLGMTAPAGVFHPGDAAGNHEPPEAAKGIAREGRLGFGNAVHAALERSAARAWASPADEELAELLAAEGVDDPAELARARAMVDGWLGSSLLAELRGSRARAEVPFALEIGGAIARGQIDLLVDTPPTVIDFKTDRLGDGGPDDLGDRYETQRQLYALALALADANGDPPAAVRAIHVFLEAPDDPVVESFDGERLAAARDALEQLIAGIRAGRFEPTAEPSHSVCFGCPAAERLCPHPKWKPGWG